MRKKRNKKLSLNIIKICIFLIGLIIIFNLAPNYAINDNYAKGKINLIINNDNITNKLKYDLFINDKNVIYMSKEDIKEYFDKDVIYDEENNQIITTYGEKVAELPLGENVIIISNFNVDVLSGAIKKEDIYYLPITAMGKIYEIDIEYIKEEQILLVDSLTKKLVKADVSKKCDVKYMATSFSKTVDKLERGSKVVCIEELENNWTKIRTENGKIGYVKTKVLQNEVYVREDVEIVEK